MCLTVCPPSGLGSITSHGGVFQEIFAWLIALCQPVLNQQRQNGSISPQRHHTNCGKSRRKAEVQPRTDNGLDKQSLPVSMHCFYVFQSEYHCILLQYETIYHRYCSADGTEYV